MYPYRLTVHMSDEDFAVLHSTLSPVVNPDSEQVTISLPHDHSLPPSLPPFLPHSLTNSLTPSLPSIYRAGKNRQMHPSLTSYEQRWLRALRTSQVGWNIVWIDYWATRWPVGLFPRQQSSLQYVYFGHCGSSVDCVL